MNTIIAFIRREENPFDFFDLFLKGFIVRDRRRKRRNRLAGRSRRKKATYLIRLSPESFENVRQVEAAGYTVGSYATLDVEVNTVLDSCRIEVAHS